MKREILSLIEERAALYSLGMLNRKEALDFERELADGSDAAADSLRVFDELVADLALSAHPIAPSPWLRETLMNRIALGFPPDPPAPTGA